MPNKFKSKINLKNKVANKIKNVQRMANIRANTVVQFPFDGDFRE